MYDIAQLPLTGASFEVRIRRAMWVLLAGLLVVASGGVASAWAIVEAEGAVETVEEATAALRSVRDGMVDQETAMRGFVLTGQEQFLERYGPGGAVADANRALLGDLVGDMDGDADDIDGLGDLEQAITSWRAIADGQIGLVRNGRRDDAVAIAESGTAKQRFDGIRLYTANIDEQLRNIIDARNQRYADLQRLLAIIGVGVLVVAAVVIAATLRWLRRSVIGPLAALTGAVGEPDGGLFSALAGDAANEVAAIARSADRLRTTKDIERNEAVLVAEQAERSRVAADLHDGPVQTLFAVQLRLQQLLARERSDPKAVELLAGGIEVLESAQADLRHLMFDLAPPGLGSRPLSEVMASTAPQLVDAATAVKIDIPDDGEFTVACQLVLCRVAVETLRNVAHHARATVVVVRVRAAGDVVVLDVIDDGVGFNPEAGARGHHFGLGLMRSLVESVGGNFSVVSEPGRGTTVQVTIPA